MATTTTFISSPEPSPYLSREMLGEDTQPIYTIDELIKRRAHQLVDSPLLGYPKNGIVDFEEHSARAVDRYVDAAVEKLRELGLEPVDSAIETPPVIGILAQSGLHVIITIIALSRLGYTVFLLSTRLASPALIQLLELANCTTILTTEAFLPLLTEVQKVREVRLKSLLVHSDYYNREAPVFFRNYDGEKESKKIAIIIHSSGSTGLPKPIYLSHGNCIASFATNMNLRALIASPLFHSQGFYETFRSIYSGKPIYFCNYSFALTRKSLIDMITTVQPDLFHCVPYMIKLLAESEDGVQSLVGVKLVLYGGSACPDDLGHKLVGNGVFLVGNYGATETGRLMNSNRPTEDTDWNYLRMLPSAKPYVLMDQITPDLYECVALDGLKSKSTVNSDDPPNSFRTRDLFTPHPIRPGLWKYACRIDDRFTLINGEKVLPIPIEGRIRQEELVKEACVFGDGRSFPGLLVIKADKATQIPNDEYITRIWPAIEAANATAEAFSHIQKELIVVLPAGTQYPQTDKGTFIRVPLYRQFDKEISAAYDKYENEEGGKLCLVGRDLEDFLIRTLHEKVGVRLESYETDFFAAGIDSLQCLQVWNVIKRQLDLGGKQADLSQNVLYDTGNVKELARHLTSLKNGEQNHAQDELLIMEELITKYSSFQVHEAHDAANPDKEVVLLTGVTGGLGTHILAQLVAQPNIAAVWTLARAPSVEDAYERVQASLRSREIGLGSEYMEKIIALPCNLSRSDLGLERSKLLELRQSLTCVIHSAWAVNFNIPVQSFEEQHIKGTHNLIQLCLSVPKAEPARFYFCSSVSAAGGSPRPGIVAESYVSTPAYAQKTGYARSKYVTEHITCNAATQHGFSSRVLRVGQLVGDSRVGEWNATEGIPMMIQTAVTMGALPDLDEKMSWLPVDYAAAVIIELAGLSEQIFTSGTKSSPMQDPKLVYHVLNPTHFHWGVDMIPALEAAGLQFDLLSTAEWMERLRNSEKDPTLNPPIKLLNWFEGKYGKDGNPTKTETLIYATDQTLKASPTLRAIPNVTAAAFVEKMIARLLKKWNTGQTAI